MKAVSRKGTIYRLGVYDVLDDSAPVRFIGRTYDDSADDAEIMEETIREYNELVAPKPGHTFALAAFPFSGQCSGHEEREESELL